MVTLFDSLHAEESARSWKVPQLPSLSGVRKLYLNFETSGLKWWEHDRPIAASMLLPDGSSYYIPWAHRPGGNLDEEVCRRYFQHELRNIHIVNTNTKFEVHNAREWGVDLEAQGCTVSDVAHHVALLDDRRRRFALDVLIKELLGKEPMRRVDESRMADYHPGEVAARSKYNVQMVKELEDWCAPKLLEQDLMRVKQLEDEVIYAVAEMERNAIPVDVDLLNRWHVESEQRYLRYLYQIHRETGLQFNPGSAASWEALFQKLHIDWPYRTATGQIVTTDNLIKKLEHPVVQLARKAGKLQDLRSDYIEKYWRTVGSDGLLRFSLHQLRGDDGGTISGRFSGSAIKVNGESIGCNPQQIPDIAKQVDKGHDTEYIIRRLLLFDTSADAKQIEYRLFASYANNQKVIEAYEKDPNLSFHKLIHGMMIQHVPDLIYEQQKNVNFMKIYGGGIAKLAFMLGFIDEHELEQLKNEFKNGVPRTHPKLAKAVEVNKIYDRELPEVGPLLNRASHVAKPECDDRCDRRDEYHRLGIPHRGYVHTITGRRQRFPDGRHLHKALNAVIQGGAADIMKRKMVEVHRNRKAIGFIPRLTNHDELCGNSLAPDTAKKLNEILNEQSFPELRVPILWDTKTGKNWAEC